MKVNPPLSSLDSERGELGDQSSDALPLFPRERDMVFINGSATDNKRRDREKYTLLFRNSGFVHCHRYHVRTFDIQITSAQ